MANERKVNSYLAEFQPVELKDLTMHERPGEELVFVLSGTLIIHIGKEEHMLCAGDSICFDSSVPHGYRERERNLSRAVFSRRLRIYHSPAFASFRTFRLIRSRLVR